MHHIHESGICYQEDDPLATNLQNLVVLSCYLFAIVYPFNYSGCFDFVLHCIDVIATFVYSRDLFTRKYRN